MTRPVTSRDRALLRSAARRVGVQTGILVFVAFCLCAGVLLLLVLRAQHRDNAATLRSAVAHADDVTDPPSGTWLAVQLPNGGRNVTPGAPGFLPDQQAISRASGSSASLTNDIHTEHGEFRVLTVRQNGRVVQAALSLATQHAERTRLLEALGVAGAVAIAVAGLLGAVAGRRSAAPLAAALARQRSFVADASHELRTPLTHLTTRAQLIERDLARGHAEAAREDTALLLADSRRLSAILEDLLAAAEPPDDTEWTGVRLLEVAAATGKAAEPDAAQGGVRILVDGAPEASQLEVRAPRAALDRALLALLDNAIRHTPGGGEVRIIVGRQGSWGLVQVADTGSGIAPQELDRLFDRFAHGAAGHGGRRRFGLGLALVADTADRLGGEISVESQLGRGTTMTLRLPLAGPGLAARGAAKHRRPGERNPV